MNMPFPKKELPVVGLRNVIIFSFVPVIYEYQEVYF